MKMKFNFITALFVFGILGIGIEASGKEKTKEYNESWPAAGIQTLEVNNKFGEVKITNRGGDDVTIDVVITVEAGNESKAEELLDQINVRFGKSGSTLKAETRIDSDFKSRRDFSIDYLVNIPTDKNLDISNKYGNILVNVLNANGTFDIQYGNFTVNELNTPASGTMNIFLAYGKADVGSSNDLKVEVKYSTMNFGQIDDLKLDSKYTVVNLGSASSVVAESKYDTFNFEEMESFFATAKYTHIEIEKLFDSFEAEADYGGIRVGEIAPGFKSISITNSYGQVSLGLGDASYTIDARCDYCSILYPEDAFKGEQMREDQMQTVKGKVGNDAGGTVFVKSRYGKIKLN
jgi:hypothetical protein